jgi:hypothetical protein
MNGISYMDSVLRIIENADVCATPVLILILAAVGSKMVSTQPTLRQWGVRLAAAAFIAYAIYGGITHEPTTADEWVFVLIHGLVAGGITVGFAWIFLASIHFIYRHLLATSAAKLRQVAGTSSQQRSFDSDPRLYEQEQRIREQQEAERRAREAEQTRIKVDAQRRRTDARASALLSYTMYAPKLGNRFTRDMFDKYVTDFMGDQHAAEDVERRGHELIAILDKHVQELQPPKETKTVEDLARWFQEQRERIESLPLDERTKKTHMVNLNERYAELTAKLLENMGP